jgi:hypothetical protein
MSFVTDYPAAPSTVAIDHFLKRLSVETDCADVASALMHAAMFRARFTCRTAK